MGFFEKTVTCAKCGKPFKKGVLSSGKLCEDCSWLELVGEMKASGIASQKAGITQYYKDMPKKFRTMPADADTILQARNKIFQKYQMDHEMNISVIRNASLKAAEWSDEEKKDFALKVMNSVVNTQNKMSFMLNRFVISHLYDGVAVDADSVFAIALTKNIFFKAKASEQPYLCALFTNDPYFPVIGMTFLPMTSKSFLALERTKNKERVSSLQELLPKIFPNLTYSVMDMKDMKKLVKQEGKVRGSMDPALMTELLDKGVSVPFWNIDSVMPDNMPSGIAMSIQNYGYISIEDVFRWLGLTDPVLRRHWQPYFNEAYRRSEAIQEELLEYIRTVNDQFDE